MNGNTTLAVQARGGASARGGLVRLLALGLLVGLLVPALMTIFAPSAHAEEEDPDNYSLYNLSSNTANYFNKENSPDNDAAAEDRMTETWRTIASDPATGGDMLGYADPEFNLFNVIGWLYAEATGSTQTIEYDSLVVKDGDGANVYSGMLDYAHFGAANADLGLDTMSSGVGGQILSLIGGGIMLILYSLALLVSVVFWLIIQLLKIMNPFMWFYEAVRLTADASGNTNSAHQQELADGMTGGDSGGGALAGLQHWIASWYGLLQSIAWEALVPLFIGLLLIGLVLFKKMDRGLAIKKLIVRIVFIGVGLPLLGSLYTGVLDKFDDSVWGSQAGPTRVVLSTYVDFNSWMMNDRLAVPDAALIGWDGDRASNDAMMAVRTSALAINVQSHGSTFSGIDIGTKPGDARTAWEDGTASYGRPDGCTIAEDGTASPQCEVSDDAAAVGATYSMLGRYIVGEKATASGFESAIKSEIMSLDVSSDTKKEWFIDDASYGDDNRFGDEGDYIPTNHPVLGVNGEGLTSSNPGDSSTVFTTQSTKHGCGLRVWEDDAPVSCNMSAMSAYNYLNTGFDASSMTLYSSNNVTSGLTREDHMSVSQVGTGPAKFMYWHNAATVLGSLVLLGFWYAIGMLVGAVKRTFSLVAAIPFATLGAIAAISKVIVYSIALVLEVLVTLFIYQFVSEFLISIPDIIAGPVSSLMAKDGIWGSSLLGGIIVVVLTLVSSLLVMGVTFALLRVRKVVLQAMDEVFTKLVDKFLDTNTAPKPDKSGMLPALAAGAGAGAGMAMGNKLASGVGGKLGGIGKPSTGGKTGGKSAPTNAGGLNGEAQTLGAGRTPLALDSGERPGGGDDGPDGPPPPPPGGGGPDGPPPPPPGGGGDGSHPGGGSGGPLMLTSSPVGSTRLAKETAHEVSSRGGLSNLGYSTGDQPGSRHGSPGQGSGSSDGQTRTENTERTSGGRKTIAGQSSSTQFGTGPQGAQVPGGQAQQGTPGARFTAGTSGPAQLNSGRAGVPATPGAPAVPGSSSATPATPASRPTTAPRQVPRRPQAGVQRQQSPAPAAPASSAGVAPAARTAPAQTPRPAQARPQTPAQQAPASAGRPQASTRRESVDPSVPSGTRRQQTAPAAPAAPARAAAPQQQAPAPAPSANPAPPRRASAPAAAPETGSRATSGSQASPGSAAKPRRSTDRAPKRTDEPVAGRKPTEKPKG